MSSEEDLLNRLKLNREHKKRLWKLNNAILSTKIERLQLLRHHYQEHWLDLDLKCYDSKLDSLVSKTKFTVSQTAAKRIEGMVERFKQEDESLDKQIAEAQSRLDKFKNLDPHLLAEYRKLKDDLECQAILIAISEENEPIAGAD